MIFFSLKSQRHVKCYRRTFFQRHVIVVYVFTSSQYIEDFFLVLSTYLFSSAAPPGAQESLDCAPGSTRVAGWCYRHLCSREHKYRWIVLPGAHSREHKYRLIVLLGAQSSNIRAPGSTIQRLLCSREHNSATLVLPGAQSSGICEADMRQSGGDGHAKFRV